MPVILLIAATKGHTDGFVGLGVVIAAGLALGACVGSQRLRASMATSSLLVSCGLLIHLFGGLIEMHFHFFVVLAVVAMYQAWTPYLVGLGFVVAHHALMGIWMPGMVYNHPLAVEHPVIFMCVHAGFVLAEAVALLTSWKVAENAIDAERDARVAAESSQRELTQAHGQIADLLAMMSHDLRTPVTVVTGYGDTLQESWPELDDETRVAFVARMTRAGRSLDQMLTETLTLAALDTHGVVPTPRQVSLADVVVEVLEATVSERADEVVTDVGDVEAYVDPGHLKQILSNLLSNAVKYGADPITISAATAAGGVEIRVRDSGQGVPDLFVPQLFDRWARADEVRGGATRGTGLGLHIVRQLALSNAGDIGYEPCSDGGACFVLTLPASQPHAAVPLPRASEAPRTAVSRLAG